MTFLPGLRVLDLTDERGLLAGRMLADLGADVVQVEPSSGSSARRRAPHLRDENGHLRPDASYVWEAYAANKRGVVADLDTAEGADLVRRLAAVADVVLESDGPRIQGPRGLDAEDLRGLNPRLVYASISAFGRTGPKAGRHAADLVLWAAGGHSTSTATATGHRFASRCRRPTSTPPRTQPPASCWPCGSEQ